MRPSFDPIDYLAHQLYRDDAPPGQIGPRWWCLAPEIREKYVMRAQRMVGKWAAAERETERKYAR